VQSMDGHHGLLHALTLRWAQASSRWALGLLWMGTGLLVKDENDLAYRFREAQSCYIGRYCNGDSQVKVLTIGKT